LGFIYRAKREAHIRVEENELRLLSPSHFGREKREMVPKGRPTKERWSTRRVEEHCRGHKWSPQESGEVSRCT